MNKKCFTCHKTIRGEHPAMKIEVNGLFLKIQICNACGDKEKESGAFYRFVNLFKINNINELTGFFNDLLISFKGIDMVETLEKRETI